jgi:hypothetical protein
MKSTLHRGYRLLSATLAGLPEMKCFENQAQRDRALAQIARQTGGDAGSLAGGISVLVVATLVTLAVSQWLLGLWNAPPLAVDVVPVVVALLCSWRVLCWLHRRGFRPALRAQLVEAGVPVCQQCGYLLRGLARDHARCPECGWPFSEAVRRLLPESAAPVPAPTQKFP